MKKLKEMNLPEAEQAFDDSLRKLPVGFHLTIAANPAPCPTDEPQLAHVKAAYRRVEELRGLALPS